MCLRVCDVCLCAYVLVCGVCLCAYLCLCLCVCLWCMCVCLYVSVCVHVSLCVCKGVVDHCRHLQPHQMSQKPNELCCTSGPLVHWLENFQRCGRDLICPRRHAAALTPSSHWQTLHSPATGEFSRKPNDSGEHETNAIMRRHCDETTPQESLS